MPEEGSWWALGRGRTGRSSEIRARIWEAVRGAGASSEGLWTSRPLGTAVVGGVWALTECLTAAAEADSAESVLRRGLGTGFLGVQQLQAPPVAQEQE